MAELAGYRNIDISEYDFVKSDWEIVSHLRCQMSDNQFTKHPGLLFW